MASEDALLFLNTFVRNDYILFKIRSFVMAARRSKSEADGKMKWNIYVFGFFCVLWLFRF